MTDNNSAEATTPSGGSGCLRFLGVLLRLIFILILGVGLGGAAYFGVPALYRNFVEPVQENSRRIDRLEAGQSRELTAARDQVARLEEDLAGLEERLFARADEVTELQASVEELQGVVEQQNRQLRELDAMASRVDGLEDSAAATDESLADLSTAFFDSEAPTQKLTRQLQLVRAMELLTRARLWIEQDNLGLATDDVEAAREGLAALRQASPEEEVEALTSILERLDLALEDIRTAPDLAAADLEVAWRLLLDATALPDLGETP